jgi:hypothetical protein
MSNPLNAKALEEVEAATKCQALFFVSVNQDIKNALNNLYNKKKLMYKNYWKFLKLQSQNINKNF